MGMISLESLGYYSTLPGSQHYPLPLRLLYPGQGGFVAFVANPASRRLLHAALGAFRGSAAFPSEGAVLPAAVPGAAWSDHWGFWEQGYQAIMLTDTAPFRNPHYHTADDTPDKLDFDRLTLLTSGLSRMAAELAGAG